MTNGENVRIRAEVCKSSLQSLFDFLISESCPEPSVVALVSTALVHVESLIEYVRSLEVMASK